MPVESWVVNTVATAAFPFTPAFFNASDAPAGSEYPFGEVAPADSITATT